MELYAFFHRKDEDCLLYTSAILTPPAKEDALPDMEPEEPGPAMSQ